MLIAPSPRSFRSSCQHLACQQGVVRLLTRKSCGCVERRHCLRANGSIGCIWPSSDVGVIRCSQFGGPIAVYPYLRNARAEDHYVAELHAVVVAGALTDGKRRRRSRGHRRPTSPSRGCGVPRLLHREKPFGLGVKHKRDPVIEKFPQHSNADRVFLTHAQWICDPQRRELCP
jgi:hypothetical protein